jgi:excisionase family DNA binding protein
VDDPKAAAPAAPPAVTDQPEKIPRKRVVVTGGQWMAPPEAAQYLGFSLKGLYQHVRKGQVPAHRVGRSLRFNRDELDAAVRDER